MPVWRLRDFHDDDLDQAIALWDQSRGTAEPVYTVAARHRQDQFRQGRGLAAGLAVRGAVPVPAGRGRTGGLAASLRETFAELAELDEVVLFIDEVEEIAGMRSGSATSAAHGVTNELLKLIPAFREADHRLLVCATNSVRSLDSAFLRPGRFDYVIPIGPPDAPARRAIWERYLDQAHAVVDLDRLVASSELFTPADIEFAARKGAQAAFEREVHERRGEPAITEDFLAAVADTRPTLTAGMLTEFEQDSELYSRL